MCCFRRPVSCLLEGLNGSGQSETNPAGRRGPRWWPLALLGVLLAARLAQVWLFRDQERQFKFASTWSTLRLAGPAALVWLVLLSGMRWRTRLAALAALALAAGLAASLVRVRGINGDRVPVLEWRWSSRNPLPAATPAVAAPGRPARPVVEGAGEFPQFQGPSRDAILPGTLLATNWSAQPPAVLWRRPVGEGWSGIAVSSGLAVTMEQSGESEVVVAMDLADGARAWTNAVPARYENSQAGNGPRSTPSIAGGRVFTTGATGILRCLDLATGHTAWAVDLVREHGARLPEWGYSASPLVVGDLVWVPAGGTNRSLVAHDAATGKFRFGGGNSPAAYSSPVAARLAGVDQVLVLNDVGIAGHDASDGRLLWEQRIPEAPHVAAPVLLATNRVAVSVGYGKGTFAVEVGRQPDGTWTNGLAWKSIRLKSKFSNLIPRGDTLYGLDDGALAALDLSTGALRWKESRLGHGQLVWAGDVLLVSGETGEAVMVDVGPGGMRELGRFRALADKTWNPPALAGRLLLVRNDREAVCLRLPPR